MYCQGLSRFPSPDEKFEPYRKKKVTDKDLHRSTPWISCSKLTFFEPNPGKTTPCNNMRNCRDGCRCVRGWMSKLYGSPCKATELYKHPQQSRPPYWNGEQHCSCMALRQVRVPTCHFPGSGFWTCASRPAGVCFGHTHTTRSDIYASYLAARFVSAHENEDLVDVGIF